jgi:hypothetical protein
MSPKTGLVLSPRLWWSVFVRVVELSVGFGGEVVGVVVGPFGVDAHEPFGDGCCFHAAVLVDA